MALFNLFSAVGDEWSLRRECESVEKPVHITFREQLRLLMVVTNKFLPERFNYVGANVLGF